MSERDDEVIRAAEAWAARIKDPVQAWGDAEDVALAAAVRARTPGSIRARHYDRQSVGHDHDGRVVELHLANNASAQVSAFPEGDGFLIRVWPPNGTVEYGGDNADFLGAAVRFDANGTPRLLHLDWRQRHG